MSTDDVEPLPEEILLLLRQGRPGAEPPAKAREGALAFLAAHGVMAAAAGATAAGAGHGSASTMARGGGTTALKAWGSLKASIGVGGIVIGAALGGGGHAVYVATRRAPPQAIAPSATSVAVSASSTANSPHDDAPSSVTPDTASSPSAPVGRPAAAPGAMAAVGGQTRAVEAAGRDNLLGAERNLIDTARTAVARGDGDAALATLGRHAREFPRGRLAEEREWLAIQALFLSNRGEEARARANAFRRSFPRSLMLPALDQVVGP